MRAMGYTLRNATPADAAAIAGIYQYYVENSAATFEEIAPDAGEIESRIRATLAAGFPYLVAEEGSAVIGYAYAGPYHKRSAYRFTVENSVYVRDGHHRRGIAKALMEQLIARCTAQGYRQMIAKISAEGSSPDFHASIGFRLAGRTPGVGFKFGRWYDVIEMQLSLGEGNTTLPR
jgi:L-amino acid N-acyltransferase YncA